MVRERRHVLEPAQHYAKTYAQIVSKIGHGSRRDSPTMRLGETLCGMGGTVVTDECHLFDW